MLWFQRFFPAFMVLVPLAFTLIAGRHPERAHDDVPQRTRRLRVATLIALALHVTVQAWTESDPTGLRALRAAWPVGFGTGAFMLIWFALASPALQARQPGWRPMPHHGSPEPVRSASLTRRDTTTPISRGAWILGWALFGVCAGAVAWSIGKGAPAMLVLGLGWWLGFSVFGSRSSLIEAEPMDAAGSPELSEAWASLRSFKAWCFYSLGLLATIGFAGVAVLTVFAPDMAGMSGAALGTAAGIAGGVFGTIGSVRRARVNALLQELGTREANGPTRTT